MSVTPLDILAEARDLFDNARPDEARYRTIVGRAYYAAFHALLTIAEQHGYRYSRADGAPPGRHENVIWWATRRGVPSLRVAAGRVEALKKWRVKADYHLHRSISAIDAKTRLDSASDIIEDLLVA